ncbi:MAG: hypothetical protein SNI72_07785, partial [Rikenellaceae bacterium]
MKKTILSAILILSATISNAEEANEEAVRAEVTYKYGTETTSQEYFESVYLYNDLIHYLDNQNLHITYQAETIGEYNQPDQMVFSVDGNSYRWNKYYVDGFRIDSRFFTGSSLYTTNMSNYDLSLDYINSELRFDTSANRAERAEVSFNIGDLGGISAGTSEFIRLLHPTASDRAYKPIELRSNITGAGTADLNFALTGGDGQSYMQSVYMYFGARDMVGFDNGGITDYYTEKYGKIQLNGELPLRLGGLFDKGGYFVSYAQRDHLNSEFYYGEQESPALNSYSASIYGVKRGEELNYTSGFNFALNRTEHENLNYSRNVIDHDGEAFEPWMPDGSNIEFSHSLTLDKRLNDWLTLNVDTYNTLMRFNSSQSDFYNSTYAQTITQDEATPLYLYEWHSSSFYSALLENSVGLSTQKRLSDKIDIRANFDLTLDAMLVSGNSIVSPNFELRAGFDFNITKWLNIELNLGRERVNYNSEDIQFLSNDYLTGEVYYINDTNGNGSYDSGEKGSLFTTTGGGYHSLSSEAKQPTYYVVDIPINITLGRHSLTLLNSYRKYCNNWTVGFDGDYSDYGYMEQVTPQNLTWSDAEVEFDPVDIFYFDGGKEVYYEVGDYPDGIMGDGFFTSTPFFFCSNVQYTYTAPRFTFSLNWQSYMMSGISTLGNGPLHNNIGTLSESSANPNTYQVIENQSSEYKAVGRLDQDRAYIARIFASYQVTPKLSIAANAK